MVPTRSFQLFPDFLKLVNFCEQLKKGFVVSTWGRFTSGDLYYTPRYFWGPGDLSTYCDLNLSGSGATDLLIIKT